MHRIPAVAPLVLTGVLLAACGGDANDTAPPTATEAATTPSASATATATPRAEPTDAPTVSPTPTATPAPTSGRPGDGPSVRPHAEADRLFLDRDRCTNERDNYEVEFPDAWYTNTEIGRTPACVWFSPTDYDAAASGEVPDEIAITIDWVQGDVGRTDADVRSSEEVTVGGQRATRTEWDDGAYWYVVQLGPTQEEGPNLLVATSDEMAGDVDLNRAVMDRMMTTIEFFGSVD